MARVAIVAMIAVAALLVWRDWVLEREIRLLAAYDAAHHSVDGELQIAMRDERIDDAMWQLVDGEMDAARETIDDVTRMSAPTPLPPRAWRIAAALRCPRLGELHDAMVRPYDNDPRVRKFCALNMRQDALVKK